jgi:hypothetical protein
MRQVEVSIERHGNHEKEQRKKIFRLNPSKEEPANSLKLAIALLAANPIRMHLQPNPYIRKSTYRYTLHHIITISNKQS